MAGVSEPEMLAADPGETWAGHCSAIVTGCFATWKLQVADAAALRERSPRNSARAVQVPGCDGVNRAAYEPVAFVTASAVPAEPGPE
jgi:hypothetical protein